MTLLRYAVVPFMLSFWACSSDSNEPNSSNEGVLVGPTGGTVVAEGAQIVIPPGALDHEVRITTESGGTLPAGYTGLSRLFTFGPDGTTFLKPVNVSFDLPKAGVAPTVYWSTAGGGFIDAHGVVSGTKIGASVTHFSQGFVAETVTAAGGSGGSSGSSQADDGGSNDGGSDDGGSAPDLPSSAGAGGTGGASAGAGGTSAGTGGTSVGTGGTSAGTGGTSVGTGGTSAGTGGASAGAGGANAVGPVTFTVRNTAGAASNMTWAAWQDGTGAWQALTPSSTGSYSIAPVADHFGVAFMCASADSSNSQGSIVYGTSAKRSYDITASVNCAPVANPANYSFAATLSNAPVATTVYLIGSEGISASSASATVHDYNVPQAATRDFLVGAASPTAVLRASFLRGVTFNDNVTRNVDLEASGFDVGTQTLDIGGAISTTSASVYYAMTPTATLGFGLLRATTFNAGTSQLSGSFASVPSANQESGDTYLVDVADSSATASRRLLRRFHGAANVSGTMPPDMVANATIAAAVPYLQPHYVLTQRAGATTYTASWYYAPVKGVAHSFSVQIEPAYLSGSGETPLDFPDLSGVSGWDHAWAAPSSAAAGSLSATAAVTTITDANGVHEEASASKTVPLP